MSILIGILKSLVVLVSLFMILLVLIQRGKGGGLAGAFGGMGGSSAFGTKAGDVFTRVTMIIAGVWVALSMMLVILSNRGGESAWGADPNVSKVSRDVTSGSGSSKGKSTRPKNTPSTPPAPVTKSPVSVPAIPESAK